jgi:catechol-2,3-dioxygenase
MAGTFQMFHDERKLNVKDVEQVLAFYCEMVLGRKE